ncbi:MAG: DNA internalization-related competence protein ComEC/Rec2, partial [Lachnospiraceae bacterium]|nr:DNA internalization-related competence protein ComEC/Rec2 [Lachnospiraceae bacterium]
MYLVIILVLTVLTRPEPYLDESSEGETITLAAAVQTAYFKNSNLVLELYNAQELPENLSGYDISAKLSKINLNNEKGYGVIAYIPEASSDFVRPKCGSSVVVMGKKALFERAENFGQFDMAAYEQLRGKDYCLFDSRIVAESSDYDVLREGLLSLREKAAKVYSDAFNRNEAGILDAMVLGDRTSLPREIKGMYQRNGVAHALSISGLHIGIIGYGLYRLLRRLKLSRYLSTGISIVIMLLYCVMTGSPLSAMRSFIMFALGLYSDICKRSYDMLSSMALSMMILLTAQPMRLYEAGFWLSYGAVAGAGLMFPYVKSLIGTDNKVLSAFLLSLSISVFTFPITAYFFYQIPLYGVLLNLFLIPLLTPLLFAALLTAVSGLLFSCPFFPAVAVCKAVLFIIERGCALCERLPMGNVVTGRPELWKIAVFYLGLAALMHFAPRLKEPRIRWAVNIAAVAVLTGLQCVHLKNGLNLTMLSVGQGQCIFIRSPDGYTCLYDCGSTSEKDIGEYRIEPFLKASGISTIDCCIVSHTDEDHISGLLELLEDDTSDSLRIESLIMPDIGNPDEIYTGLVEAAKNRGAKVYRAASGDRFSLGDIEARCLNPERGICFEDKNTYSLVLELKYRDFSALLTGDVQNEGEENTFLQLDGAYDVLQAAHHGSKNSTPVEFLEEAEPEVV